MAMAPPGMVTGTYYIILGNIPKKKRSNELRQFVQQSGFSVVNAHVHQNLGCGYVSVLGADAFLQLCQWLQKVVWEGKTLQVDMRNQYHETALGPSSPPAQPGPLSQLQASPNGNSMNGGVGAAIQIQYSQYPPRNQVPLSPVYGAVESGLAQGYSSYAPTSMTYATTPSMPTSAYPTNQVNGNLITSPYQYGDTSQYAPAVPQQQPIPISYTTSTYSAPGLTSTAAAPQSAPPAQPQTVSTSNRLVYFTRVPGCSSTSEIKKKVVSVLPSSSKSKTEASSAIRHIYIPVRADGAERGHALVLMASEELARRVVSRLDGEKVRSSGSSGSGKKGTLRVKIAKEGVSEEELAMMSGENGNGNGSSLSTKMGNMSLASTEEEREQAQGYGGSIGSSTTTENTSASTPPEEEIPGTGRRRSSLPIVNGSFPESTKAEPKGKSSSRGSHGHSKAGAGTGSGSRKAKK